MILRRLLLAALVTSALAFGNVSPTSAQLEQPDDLVTIFYTGDVQGAIASCGCPKLDLGGMTRRAAFLDTLRVSGWDFLTVDAGGIVPFAPMDARKWLKAEHLAKAMARVDLDAVALGYWDLAHGQEYAEKLTGWLDQPILATNYTLPSDKIQLEKTRQFEVKGKTVGMVAFLDPLLLTEEHEWIGIEPWNKQEDLIKALSEEVDVLVALANVADSSRMVHLAEIYPELDLIIGSHRGDLPSNVFTAGNTRMVGGGHEGKYLGRADFSFDEEGAIADMRNRYLEVLKRWGRRPWIDEVVTEFNRSVRDLLTSPEGD